LTLAALIKQRVQPWQVWLFAGIAGYLSLSAATNTLRTFHWYMLLVVPVAFFGTEKPKRFFLDWLPLFAFWLVYDRLRLVQPMLLDRVAVAWPYDLECLAFGWLTGGQAPAHWSRAWLATQAGSALGDAVSLAAQFIYLSHLFVLPLILLYFWIRGFRHEGDRASFTMYMRAFLALHAMAIAIYLLLPVAPPWWVSLNGAVQPTSELVAATKMTAAMDGVIVQGLIKSASNWFAAVPSLHGAYPVLMVLLAALDKNLRLAAALAAYMVLMFASTVVLNQHYIIDLFAGGVIAVLAGWLAQLKRQ
jgi:hypothetical protein